MRDRKGWKALGYESFIDYGKKSLGYEKGYLYQLADAGEISLQLGYSQESAIADSPPPESQLRPLKSVPEEARKSIWDEATRKADEEGAKLTAQRVEDAVREWKQRQQESQADQSVSPWRLFGGELPRQGGEHFQISLHAQRQRRLIKPNGDMAQRQNHAPRVTVKPVEQGGPLSAGEGLGARL